MGDNLVGTDRASGVSLEFPSTVPGASGSGEAQPEEKVFGSAFRPVWEQRQAVSVAMGSILRPMAVNSRFVKPN
jgi:hypothetical protein